MKFEIDEVWTFLYKIVKLNIFLLIVLFHQGRCEARVARVQCVFGNSAARMPDPEKNDE